VNRGTRKHAKTWCVHYKTVKKKTDEIESKVCEDPGRARVMCAGKVRKRARWKKARESYITGHPHKVPQ